MFMMIRGYRLNGDLKNFSSLQLENWFLQVGIEFVKTMTKQNLDRFRKKTIAQLRKYMKQELLLFNPLDCLKVKEKKFYRH